MGFYIRKSVRCGPLRFNLSKSGIGVSTGVPGFRIGTGPRGTYVHMGRGGLYYRKTLSLSNTATRTQQSQQQPYSPTPVTRAGTHGPMMAIGSGSVSDMTDTSSADLLAEIEQKRQRFVWWPIVAVLSFILAIAILRCGVAPWLSVPIVVLLVIGVILIHQWDQLKKSVVLMYDLDGAMLDSFQRLFNRSNRSRDAARSGTFPEEAMFTTRDITPVRERYSIVVGSRSGFEVHPMSKRTSLFHVCLLEE